VLFARLRSSARGERHGEGNNNNNKKGELWEKQTGIGDGAKKRLTKHRQTGRFFRKTASDSKKKKGMREGGGGKS